MGKPIIAPSILAADFSKLGEAVSMIHNSQAEYVHIDVMDGVFVPNISFGLPVIQSVRKYTDKLFDVHLMIVQPERYIADFKKVGADLLTVHIEASTHLHRTLQAIKQEGMQTGVALNPHTSLKDLEYVLDMVDLVCLMSVNPGFGGQKFIESTYRKVSELRNMIEQKNTATKIEIDGGVNAQNAPLLVEAGADVLVAGSFVFNSENPTQTIADILA